MLHPQLSNQLDYIINQALQSVQTIIDVDGYNLFSAILISRDEKDYNNIYRNLESYGVLEENETYGERNVFELDEFVYTSGGSIKYVGVRKSDKSMNFRGIVEFKINDLEGIYSSLKQDENVSYKFTPNGDKIQLLGFGVLVYLSI